MRTTYVLPKCHNRIVNLFCSLSWSRVRCGGCSAPGSPETSLLIKWGKLEKMDTKVYCVSIANYEHFSNKNGVTLFPTSRS